MVEKAGYVLDTLAGVPAELGGAVPKDVHTRWRKTGLEQAYSNYVLDDGFNIVEWRFDASGGIDPTGYGDPRAPMPRQEVAQLLYNVLGRLQ